MNVKKKNMGDYDRQLRAVGAIVALLWAVYAQNWWLALIGLALLATAYLRWCPSYIPFDINTIEKK